MLQTRGQGFGYLPGSKKEVVEIGGILRNHGWAASVYTDNRATETRFKSLSGDSPDIIHVSTHGYYFEYEEGKEELQAEFFRFSEDPLLRCGLLFTGANNVWRNGGKTDSPDDGILTGYEIAAMDLSATRLVVLSACNTALGDIDYREGIYGLQRAFRLAGAGAMIVALWPVNDHHTVAFMQELYTHIGETASTRAAFNKTVQKMRESNPDNLECWAGFMLVE